MLSESAVAQFKEIYEKRLGCEITPDEAREKASRFLGFIELILTPLKEEEFQKLRARAARKSI